MSNKTLLEDRKVKDTFCCFGTHQEIDRCYCCIDEGFCEIETKWRMVEKQYDEKNIKR
jgi:hypothetical protein